MSRFEKRIHQAAQLQAAQDGQTVESVRLFAFSNLGKGHQSQFAPEDSIVVLKSKSTNPKVHPCAQWLGLSQELYRRDPVMDQSHFILDTTGLPPQLEFEEEASVVLSGPVLKRSVNILSRLNLNRGTLVAAGASAVLGAKLLLLGDRSVNSRGDPLFKTLLLVCPKSPEPLEALVRHGARHQKTVHPWKLVILLGEAVTPVEVNRWNTFLKHRETQIFFEDSKVVQQESSVPLFASIATALGVEATGKVISDDSELSLTRLPQPRLYEVSFVLSKFTKQAEQEIEPRDMDDWGIVQQSSTGLALSATATAGASTATDQDAPAKPSSGKKVSFSDAAAARSSNPSSSHLSSSDSIGSNSTAGVVVERMPPLCELMYSRRSTARAFELDAYVVQPEKGIVANAHGAMTVVVAAGDATGGKDGSSPSSSAGKSPLAHLETNTPIRVRVVVRRSLKGRMTLELCDAAGSLKTLSQDEVLASPYLSSTATGAASWLPVSQVSHCVGILIVRGHQCVLVRSLSGEYNGMRFPYQAHDDATQSSLECAIEAACIQCDISEDNFAVHPCIAPVMYYPAPMTCVTIYVAIANYPSSSSAMAGGEEEDLNDPYDWKPYEGALKSLTTKAERAAFVKLVDNIQCAASAGMYTPPLSLPVFGPSTSAAGPASITAHESYDGMLHAPLAVTVVHTSDLQATPEVLLNAFGVSTSPHKNSDVLVLTGLIGEEEGSPSVAFITEWIASAAAAPTAEKYILLDSAHGKDSVLYFKSYAADITEAATRRGITCTLKLVEVVTPQVQMVILAAIPGVNSSSEQQQQVIDVPSLIVGLEGADIVLLVASSDEKQQQVVLDFIRVVISDVNPVPVLGDWQNPDEYLLDLQDDDQSHHDTASGAFMKYTYRRSLPFNPQSFANVSSSNAVRALLTEPLHSASMHLVSMSGYVWISTRFGYRGEVTLSTSSTVEIAQGDPWWCLVDEADRPSNCNPANWDKQHGDRAQQISFVIARNSTPAQREGNPLDVAAAIIESVLDPALCGAQEWRTWNRHADPLAPWDA